MEYQITVSMTVSSLYKTGLYNTAFLPRESWSRRRVSVRVHPSVRLSVTSRGSSKTAKCKQRHTLSQGLCFSDAKLLDMWTGSLQTGRQMHAG